jgi:hypothetical protein
MEMIIFLLILFLAVLLIALTVGAWMIFRHEASIPSAVPDGAVQKIFSSDGNLKAMICNRPDGTYQMEVRRRGQDDSPDAGIIETWTLVYGPAITGSLEEAVEIANQRVGVGAETQP